MNSLTRLPRIGITTYGQNDLNCFYLPRAYVEAIRRAGGLPMLLPPGETNLEAILATVDGLLLPGGGDINPMLYGGSDHPAIYNVDPERDAFELPLAQLALQRDIPILGICRGLQVLSVVSGADLVAHVPDEFGSLVIHRAERTQPTQHPVDLLSGTRLVRLMEQSTLMVNSLHHQAVREVPPGWQVAARAADGLIEAIEHRTHPWALALQWHPELSPDNLLQCRIFQAFVAAAQGQEIAPLPQKNPAIAVP
ncbi:MAG: gamma-glutamyl-gamma-aminobutyrate hydrolase family protein [Leptolyngbyaceae cyanobacterium bins.59]|nr:gamma-glutamyl-gamma-aminobutyrate hydrolase family protein [Leptolyngbyaceae cyanobacterium bins.59]